MFERIIGAMARYEFKDSLQFTNSVEVALPRDTQRKERLLYLHIPFCERLCPYCSFHRIAFDETLCREYFQALRKELLIYKRAGYDFNGIYVGGGTPTVLIDELALTLSLARKEFSISEISVETNPNHLTKENVHALHEQNVDRLSVGIQSFDDSLLKKMQRYDKYGSGEMIAKRMAWVNQLFPTVNADMIFNFPTQSEAMLNRDLEILLSLGLSQITYYPLMASKFAQREMANSLGIVDYRKEKKFYKLIREQLKGAYGFSSPWCFSRKETMIDEYIVNYDEYAGLGSGAIGYINGVCYANTFDINEYIKIVNNDKMSLLASRTFSIKEMVRYDFVMKLFGVSIDINELARKYAPSNIWRYLWFDISAFMLAGGLKFNSGKLHLSRRGCYYWVVLMREFFIAVNNFRDFCRKPQ